MVPRCSVCDARIDAYGRDGTLCKDCVPTGPHHAIEARLRDLKCPYPADDERAEAWLNGVIFGLKSAMEFAQ